MPEVPAREDDPSKKPAQSCRFSFPSEYFACIYLGEARQNRKDNALIGAPTLHARAGKMHKQSTAVFTTEFKDSECLDEGIEEAVRVAQHRAGVGRSPNLQVR